MPLDNKTTSNGVDLNQIDVSKLALVEKDGLIKDITAKLKKGIEEAFDQGMDDLEDTLKDAKSDDDSDSWKGHQQRDMGKPSTPKSYRRPSSSGAKATSPEQEIKKQQDEFEKLRKLSDRVDRQMDRVFASKRKNDKQS